MSFVWTSGARGLVCDVCAGDLLDVRLKSASLAERAVDGYPPHIVFVPAFDTNDPERLGGQAPLTGDPVEFRLDLAPTYFPLRGQLHLDGGTGVAYEGSYSRSKCRKTRAREDWTITLRDIGAVTPIAFPRGVYAISVPRDSSVSLVAKGDTVALVLAAGHRCPLGHLAQGTIVSAGGTIEMVHCHVRL